MTKNIKQILKEFKQEINKAPITYSNNKTTIFLISPYFLQQMRINEKISLPNRDAKIEEEKLLRVYADRLKSLDPSEKEINETIDSLQKVLEKYRTSSLHNFDIFRESINKKFAKICESHNTKNAEVKRKVLLDFVNDYGNFAKKYNLDKANQEKDMER